MGLVYRRTNILGKSIRWQVKSHKPVKLIRYSLCMCKFSKYIVRGLLTANLFVRESSAYPVISIDLWTEIFIVQTAHL